jgi:hypothetical protein
VLDARAASRHRPSRLPVPLLDLDRQPWSASEHAYVAAFTRFVARNVAAGTAAEDTRATYGVHVATWFAWCRGVELTVDAATRPGHRLARVSQIGPQTGKKGSSMSVQMASAKIKPEGVTDVQAATKKMFAAINAAQPNGIRYASLLLADGETFVAIVQLDDGVENPVPGFPEFRELQEVVERSRAEPNNVQSLTVIGSYRLF